jgi:FlaA1/EpsC-like NDP-sugar epimerase
VPPDFFASPQHRFDWPALLGRSSAALGSLRIPSAAGARVLVTGAGGFIGSAMVRAFAASGAEQIMLLEIAEQPLFEIHAALTALGQNCVAVLGSVTDRQLLDELFRDHRPQLILHAAALKHAPLMEHNPLAAVATNALGTWTLTQAAEKYGAQSMLLVSTDKAVAPHSIMGAAKRVAEMVMLAPADANLRKTAVRLVNVIGSPASVADIFARQIAAGQPVTVTHPAARRYFFTLDETSGLLAEALATSIRGLLIPEPGEPILISELAQRMISASSSPGLPIVFTAERPGDKRDESLLSDHESLAGPATAHLQRVHSPITHDLEAQLHALAAAIAAHNPTETLRVVAALVPDYHPSVLLEDALTAAARP